MSNELTTTSDKATTPYHRPHYLVSEEKESYRIEVYMPGVDKEDVIVSLQDNELLVEGKKSNPLPVDAQWLHREITDGGYQLRLQLNVEIDADDITANSEDGILLIQLPVAKAALPRSIRIN